MKEKYSVHGLDVWTEEDGCYTVNDVYPSNGSIYVDGNDLDEAIIQSLIDNEFFSTEVDFEQVGIEDQGGYIYITYDGKPLFELRSMRHEL